MNNTNTSQAGERTQVDSFGYAPVGADLCAHHREDGQIVMRSQNGGRLGLTHSSLFLHAPELLKALHVLTLDVKIARWLAENDPKALEQARNAITLAKGGAL